LPWLLTGHEETLTSGLRISRYRTLGEQALALSGAGRWGASVDG